MWKRRSAPIRKPPATPEREMQREWVEQQIARYEFILTDHPSWTDVRVRYGMLLKLVGRFGDAAQQFRAGDQAKPRICGSVGAARAGPAAPAATPPAPFPPLESAIQIRPEYARPALPPRPDLLQRDGVWTWRWNAWNTPPKLNGGNQDFQRNLWVVLQGMQLNGRLSMQKQASRGQTPAHQKAA